MQNRVRVVLLFKKTAAINPIKVPRAMLFCGGRLMPVLNAKGAVSKGF